MRISDWSSDVCSSDLRAARRHVMGDIGDGDDGMPAALVGGIVVRLGEHRVVMVAGVFRVDGDQRNLAQVLAAAHRHRRSEEHTSELQSLMRISYAVFCLKKKKKHTKERNASQTATPGTD